MNENNKNQEYYSNYDAQNAEANAYRQHVDREARPQTTCNTEHIRSNAAGSEAIPGRERKKRRPVLTAVTAVVCAIMLMLGSGFIGAKLAEGNFDAAQVNNVSAQGIKEPAKSNNETIQNSDDTSQTQKSVADRFENKDKISDSIDILGGVNPSGETLKLTDLFIGANPAVVAISTETTNLNAFGRMVTLPAAGSGFIISEDGYIVTNNHVIENASSISVLLYDGTRHPAVLVGRDPASDLAVLKIEAKKLAYLTWGNSDELLVGEQVAAIGNPLGEFANSMTVGYISALDREINIDGTPRIMLQTDAAVNSGNSGGPLLNLKGQVIGIVSAKSGGVNVEGLGFAIPSSKAGSIVTGLINDGYIKGKAVMGVQVVTIQNEDGQTGVYIDSVNSGSAAEKAGVKEGDTILSANGKAVSTVNQLKSIIEDLSPGDKLVLKLKRESEELSLTVILDEYKPTEIVSPGPAK